MSKVIPAPKANEEALKNLLANMYISNVSKRLRELNQPSDIDRKRWIWELLQNAKDTIANIPDRKSINARIIINGDIVQFQHNGAPFTAKARLGLLYKYSEDKGSPESTGRFGTGFLTTHCLSKIVSIESNMYGDDNALVGFKVTMYRDGTLESELIEGLSKMRDSEEYYDEPFDWTTYTYHVNSDSGRHAISLGKENFKENIAQTLLFCKELSSVELDDNGTKMTIERVDDRKLNENLNLATFRIISGNESCTRSFVYSSFERQDEELSIKYKTERTIRINAACEIDDNSNVISTGHNTSLFCVFPLVGIESQLQMPIIINSPDFEPDSERQSLLLNGQDRDEEKNIITEVGINRKILSFVPDLYEEIIKYLSENRYNKLCCLANGLKNIADHEKLDKEWYKKSFISILRSVMLKHPMLKPFIATEPYRKLSDCIIIKDKDKDSSRQLYNLLASLYPNQLVEDNNDWAQYLWKNEEIKLWNIDDVCKDLESKKTINNIEIISSSAINSPIDKCALKIKWYNKFLTYVVEQNELLFNEYAILPNMLGDFLKKDNNEFKQGEKISDAVLDVLTLLGANMRPYLLHESITAISLDRKFNSNSYSAKADELSKKIIADTSLQIKERIIKLVPLFSIIVSDNNKYEENFIAKRSHIFQIVRDLFELTNISQIIDNSFVKSAWDSTDSWLISTFISFVQSKQKLVALPIGLDAKWLNDAIKSLGIPSTKLNEVAILPNQNGDFRKLNELYIDNGLPEVLKDDVFKKIGIDYKRILFDKAISASDLGINHSKCIADFISDLSNKCLAYNYSTQYYSYGKHRLYSEEAYRSVSQYLIQILPQGNCEENVRKTQERLRHAARYFFKESCTGVESVIDCVDNKLWQNINSFICLDILKLIEQSGSISKILTEQNTDEETLYTILNIVYNYIDSQKIVSSRSVYPNQCGIFCKYDSLYSEKENIDDLLKHITSLVGDDTNNLYNILLDNRCSVVLPKTKDCSSTYLYIDNQIKSLYDNPSNWEKEEFRKACQLLIDEWGECHKSLFDDSHFPKVYPIKDSISMNVVWTKLERQQLQSLKTNLSDIQLQNLVENLDDFTTLTEKTQKLEEENEKLRKIIEELRAGRECDIEEGETDSMAKRKKLEAQIEAQRRLMQERPDWIFPENYGEYNDEQIPWHDSTIDVINENGEKMPIVLKSYLSTSNKFKVTAIEWKSIIKDKAKLLVYTRINNELTIVEIPKDDLIKKQSNFVITFDSDNLDIDQYEDRVTVFAEKLQFFTGLHFDFNSFHIEPNANRVKDIHAKHAGTQTITTDNDL